MRKTFETFDAAAAAIVAGEIFEINATVKVYSDLLGRVVEYRGQHVNSDGTVTFKPDSARLSFQYGYSRKA